MESFKNFRLAGYVYAYYLDKATPEKIQADLDFYKQYVPLEKVYLETHRALVDIPEDKMRAFIKVFRDNGLEVSGGITTTVKVGEAKPAIYDTFCFSDPAHRQELLRIVRYTASLFDEFILDDFFFASCKCEMCIREKGKRSWARFKLDQMEEFSHELVVT